MPRLIIADWDLAPHQTRPHNVRRIGPASSFRNIRQWTWCDYSFNWELGYQWQPSGVLWRGWGRRFWIADRREQQGHWVFERKLSFFWGVAKDHPSHSLIMIYTVGLLPFISILIDQRSFSISLDPPCRNFIIIRRNYSGLIASFLYPWAVFFLLKPRALKTPLFWLSIKGCLLPTDYSRWSDSLWVQIVVSSDCFSLKV